MPELQSQVFLSAGINTIKLLNTDITVNLTSFLIGSLSGLTLSRLILPCLCIAIAFFVSLFLAQPLNMLGLGDDIARSLGLRVSLTRFLLLSLASILAGCVVSFAGLLGFIGLIIRISAGGFLAMMHVFFCRAPHFWAAVLYCYVTCSDEYSSLRLSCPPGLSCRSSADRFSCICY